MKHLVILLLSSNLFLLSGCSTIVGSVNEDPITFDSQERTWGSWLDDQTIETIAKVNINKAAPELNESRIKVISFNGILLIIGQVPTQDLKDLAGSTANDIQNIRKVYNELEVREPIDLLVQSNDSWLTTKIKTSMISNEVVNADKIKVNTEGGTVYLMGLATPQIAQEAVAIARDTGGVQKVVKVFEYTR
ncbi:phospholipid-binding protein [Endozoicomonas sp. (ex Bugula neritina AB1)]|nr:phospholipid-binding protein [Endozoicomonas sp. (ex Bugula neritina AB1)]